MINYSYTQKGLKKRIRIIVGTILKNQLILGSIGLILSAYFLPLGVFYMDNDALVLGLSGLIAVVAVGICCVITFCVFKKPITSNFTQYAKNGMLHYSISCENSEYILTCLESNKSINFRKNDIEKTFKSKRIIVLVLKSKQVIDVPNREDIYQLLMS